MYDKNPYRLLNSALDSKGKKANKIEEIKGVRDVLYLVMTALRKLPVVEGMTLYRGIRREVDLRQYKEGRTIVWPAFSSASPDMKVTKEFLSNKKDKEENEDKEEEGKEDEIWRDVDRENPERDQKEEKLCKGTLFIIEGAWGYDIEPYSIFQGEKEILLEPERKFEVESVIDGDEFIVVNLRMVDTPRILTKDFWEGEALMGKKEREFYIQV